MTVVGLLQQPRCNDACMLNTQPPPLLNFYRLSSYHDPTTNLKCGARTLTSFFMHAVNKSPFMDVLSSFWMKFLQQVSKNWTKLAKCIRCWTDLYQIFPVCKQIDGVIELIYFVIVRETDAAMVTS